MPSSISLQYSSRDCKSCVFTIVLGPTSTRPLDVTDLARAWEHGYRCGHQVGWVDGREYEYMQELR